jgi:O-antigen ligase
MALAWGIPKRARRVAVLLGSALITVLLFTTGFENVSMRASKVIQETHEYTQHGDTSTSSGWRINAWHRSIQAIQAQPLTGYGVGSWSPAVKRLDGDNALRDFGPGNSSNPHQEYLLWGVELGSIGPLLLVALFVAMAMDAKNFPTALRRATFSAIAVTAIACLFNSSLYDALIGDFLCTTLGLLMALGLHRSEWQK